MSKHRMTKQKKLILDIVKSTTCHPTADWVYQEARKVMPKISLGTVYRNLRLLVEMGAIMELNYGSSFSRFDGNPENHYHFVCINCDKVADIEFKEPLDLNSKVVDNIDILFHRLEIYGYCEECSVKQDSSNRR